jgi:hypothetical protein
MGIVGRMWRAGRYLSLAAAAATVTVTTACGASPSPAGTVAREFVGALDASDTASACGLLAPKTKSELEKSAGKPCAVALGEEDLPSPGAIETTEAFGTMAQVRFSEDTLFLAEFRGGWRVMAAGCAPEPGHPYDCQLGGG